MPGVNANPVGSVAAVRPPQNALLRGVLGKLSLKDVRNAPSFSRCQLGRTPGIHERKSHGDAIGYAHDVMKEAMQNASRKDAQALGRTLELLSYGTSDNLGPVLLVHLTAIGAVREGVAALLRESPGDERLATHLKQLDDAIVKTGIKAGKCELAEPDAVYLAQYPSTEKVCDAVAAGKKVMTHCAAKIGGPALLAGIAQAVLPQAMMDSLAERLPDLVERFSQAEGAPEWSEVLQSQAAWHLNKVLKAQLEAGGTEDLQSAVIQLLKTPEYILQSQRGGAGDDTDGLRRPDVPADAPAWVKQGVKDGAPILYNVVNCGGNARSSGSHRCGVQLEQIRNLLNDAREDAYERGRLTEIVRFQEHHIDRLERELQAERERNGPGEVRARKLQNERLNNASAGTLPLDEELDLIPDLDVGQVPVDLTHTSIDQIDNSERVLQRREQLNNASNEVLPPDSDLDQIKPDDRARAFARNQTGGADRIDHPSHQRRDQVHNPSSGVIPPDGSLDRTPDQGNGEGLVRRELAGGDRTDRSNRPPPQSLLRSGSNGVVPPDEGLGDIPPLDNGRNRASLQADHTDRTESSNRRDHQQQLGDAQRLVQRPSGRLDPGGTASFDDTAVVGEFERYLQALGREQTPRPRDPLQPVGPRNMVSNGDAEPSIRASDFTGYRDDRALLSGGAFAPVRTGRTRDRVEPEKDEFIELIAKHGKGKVSPVHVLERNQLRPAPPTPMVIREPDTELDRAFISLRKRNMESFFSGGSPVARVAPPRSLSRQPEPTPIPAAARSSVGSLASVVSSGSRTGSLRDQILAGSRAARGEQPNHIAFNQALEFARASPYKASDTPQSEAERGEHAETREASRRASSVISTSTSASDRLQLSDVFDHQPTPHAGEAVMAWQRNALAELEAPGSAPETPASGHAVDAGAAQRPTSAHKVALELAVQQIRRDRAAGVYGEAFGTVASLERGASMESRDSGNVSPTRLNDATSDLKSPKRVAEIEAERSRKHLRVPQLDISITEVRHVDENGDRVPVPLAAQGIKSDWFSQKIPDVGNHANPQAALMAELQRTLQQRDAQLEAS